ncbi:BnaAnng33080D [Brassica napus]|uniref:BnaAnng33080D protein n=1 Tax=Brassica napus TaxID=3708 RepID=A0A078JRQ1_BRANA|nr:BnaAnng33080D [Brassica napus]
MARYRHLVFPILEFLQEHQLYPDEQILKFKIELLNKTNMVDYAMDIHKSLHHTEDAPQDMEEAAALLVTFLLNPNAVQELRGDKKYNLQMLKERYQIGPDQIEALNQYAKFQFECGNYSASEILMQNWDIALEELNRLKDIIDSKLLLGCRSHDSGVSRLMLEETLYVKNSHRHRNLIKYLKDYIDFISTKYPFWNRTSGADHFLAACHDWAPSETRKHFSKTIRALCNSDVKEGFVFGKDTSLPETYVRYPKKPLSNIGGKSASKRPTVAFFAGQPDHGYVRPILLSYWGEQQRS